MKTYEALWSEVRHFRAEVEAETEEEALAKAAESGAEPEYPLDSTWLIMEVEINKIQSRTPPIRPSMERTVRTVLMAAAARLFKQRYT
jgi:sortase (surface protein transpeptidase)